MSGLKNTVKRTWNTHLGKGFKTDSERQQQKQMKRQGRLNKIYQSAEMPDPEDELRSARRRAAGRRGSRASTILTDDTLG